MGKETFEVSAWQASFAISLGEAARGGIFERWISALALLLSLVLLMGIGYDGKQCSGKVRQVCIEKLK